MKLFEAIEELQRRLEEHRLPASGQVLLDVDEQLALVELFESADLCYTSHVTQVNCKHTETGLYEAQQARITQLLAQLLEQEQKVDWLKGQLNRKDAAECRGVYESGTDWKRD